MNTLKPILKILRNAYQLLVCVGLFCFGAFSSLPATAQAQANGPVIPFTDNWFNRQFDWVVYVNVDMMDKFLKYPGSTMTPIVRTLVDTRFTPRPTNKNRNQDRQRYEDLWYQNQKAVGCRRYAFLAVPENSQGCIYFKPDPLIQDNIRPCVNLLCRLILEIYARKAILATIYVPKDQFENFATMLAQYNFFKLTMVYPGGPGENMSIHLLSEPQGIERYFYYDDSGRR